MKNYFLYMWICELPSPTLDWAEDDNRWYPKNGESFNWFKTDNELGDLYLFRNYHDLGEFMKVLWI